MNTFSKLYARVQNSPFFRHAVTLACVLASAFLQAFVIQVFIKPADLLSGGFTGIALLIDMMTSGTGVHIPTSLGLLMLNVPVAVLCSRSISKRFTFYSLVNVFASSAFLQFCRFTPLFDEPMLNVIFGGFLGGIACVTALQGNASTGGTDFIALYVSNKTGQSIWSAVFVGNCILYCIFGMRFGWMNAAYSILFSYISTRTISSFHHRYDRVTLQITTTRADEVIKAFIAESRHGISKAEVTGGYSGKKMYLLHTVISSYEEHDAIRVIREADPHVIVNVFKTAQFYGTFYRPPMA